jgi:hypothetical protein
MARKSVKTPELSVLRMPRFNAKASLYNVSGRYSMAWTLPASTESRVLPQFALCGHLYCCDLDGGGCVRKVPMAQ